MQCFPKSSAISKIEYDDARLELSVWFVESGGPYTYLGVPLDVFTSFCAAGSAGKFYSVQIKGRYPSK